MKPTVLVIGDRPSVEEDHQKTGPFSGPYSYQFKRFLEPVHVLAYVNASGDLRGPKFTTSEITSVNAAIRRHNPQGLLFVGELTGVLLGLCSRGKSFERTECNVLRYADRPAILIPHPRVVDPVNIHYPFHIQLGIQKLAALIADHQEAAHELVYDTDYSKLSRGIEALKTCSAFCFDIETPHMKTRDDLLLRSFSWSTDGETAYAVSPDQGPIWSSALEALLAAIENPTVEKINQNIFFDLSIINQIHGTFVRGPVHDTMQVQNFLYPHLPKALSDLAKVYLYVPPWKEDDTTSPTGLRHYNAKDSLYTFRIAMRQKERMKELDLFDYWATRRAPLYEATFNMAMTGMQVDVALRAEYATKIEEALVEPTKQFNEIAASYLPLMPPKETRKQVWDQSADKLMPNIRLTPEEVKTLKGDAWRSHLYGMGISKEVAKDLYIVKKKAAADFGWTIGEVRRKTYKEVITKTPITEINLRSGSQIQDLLYTAMKIPKTRVRKAATKSYTMDSTSSPALRKILATKDLDEQQSAVLIALLSFRELEKVIGTYYHMSLDPDNVWRYSYNQDGAITGRSTSAATAWGTGSNSQNLPSRTKNKVLKELKFKNVVVPRSGKLLMQFDQASAESVIVAHLARCPLMMAEFEKAEPDFHRLVATLCFEFLNPGKRFADQPEDFQKQFRNDCKPVSHGSSYRMFVNTLRENMFNITGKMFTIAEVEGLYRAWHKAFPEISQNWHARLDRRLDTGEQWTNVFGRRYGHFGWITPNSATELAAVEPQGTVPDITNEMLLWAYRYGRGIQVVQMGHDALLIEVPEGDIFSFADAFQNRAKMIQLDLGNGPFYIRWEASVGRSWGSMVLLSKWGKEGAAHVS